MSKSRLSLTGIDLVSLRLLIAAIEEGNLAKAADRENIAISAVSRRISYLEDRLGVKLLHRHDRGVRATAAADQVIARIRGVFDLLEQVVEDLGDIQGGTRGLVRVRTHMTATAGILPEAIAGFLCCHPGIDVELDEATSSQILHDVQVGTCDLGLVSGTVDSTELCFIPWAEDELVAILPPGHDLRNREELSFIDLLDVPFVGMQRDSALQLMYRSHAAAMGRTLNERVHGTSFEAVRRMVEVGLGAAILPARAAYPFAREDGIAVRRLREAWAKRTLMLCVRDREQVSAATRLLIEHLLAAGKPPADG